MWIFYLLIILGITFGSESDIEYRNKGEVYWQSFQTMKDNISSFFRVNWEEFRQKFKVVENFLGRFFYDVLKEHTDLKTNTVDALKEALRITPIKTTEPPVLKKCQDFVDLVAAEGYDSEKHVVVTDDGYLITLHRLLSPAPNITVGKNGVVLLHHGLLGSSDDWVLLGQSKGLAYLLLNAEYDVWLTNARGNKYSRSHINKNITEADYWNFSFHEMGRFDLAAVFDYITDIIGDDVKLHYIGYSMGATALLVLLSMLPKYNDFLKVAVLIAPLIFMQEVKGPLLFLAEYYNPETTLFLGIRENTPFEKLPSKVVNSFCQNETLNCQNTLMLLATGAVTDLNLVSKLKRYKPGGGSVKTIIHYIQLVKSGRFAMFDNSFSVLNMGTPTYKLKNVAAPIITFCSLGDWLSTTSDVDKLLLNLPNILLHHTVPSYDFSHLDFIWSNDVDVFVNYLILDTFDQFTVMNTTYNITNEDN